MVVRAWTRRRTFARHISIRYARNRILILCEGQKTEPNYFRKFPVDIKLVELGIQGAGANTLSLVRKAIRLGQEAAKKKHPYNQIWCVFDRDSFPAGNFNEAFRVARENRIRIAYSNQCFELWYFLHYHFNDTAIDRQEYCTKLTEQIGREYRKNDDGMYELLKARQQEAIRNAKRLLATYSLCNPERDDPSTTVYQLVETLNAFILGDNT